MQQPDFFWAYLPFWLVIYGLAVVAWTCIGRFLLGAFLPDDSPNYIYRWFKLLTDWAVRLVRWMTPGYVTNRWLILVTAFWFFALRYVAFFLFAAYGWAPTISPA
jgi:hypothetical protein